MKTPPKAHQPPNKPPQNFPMIEKLIETEDFSKVNQTISSAYDTLEKMLKGKVGGLAKQKAIRSALKAYDLTIDLIRELLKTKYQLVKDRQLKERASPKK